MPRTKAKKAIGAKAEKKPVRRKAASARKPRAPRTTTAEELSRDPLPEVAAVPSLTHGHSIHHYGLAQPRPRDRRQHLMIIVSISVIMAVIMFAWIMNLNRIIESDMPVPVPAAANQVDFATLKEQLSTSLAEVKDNLSSLGDLADTTSTITPSASPALSPTTSVTPSALPSTLPQ